MQKKEWVVYLIRCSDESLYCGVTNKLEYRIKQVPASNKNFELTKEENKMPKNLLKDLRAVNKDLKALAKKVDKMIVAIEKLEKPKVKAVKAKPAKKTVAKVKPVKKIVAKKLTAKKTEKLSAADIILGLIKRHRKGVEIDVLKKKSGLANQIIYNTVSRLRKQGKIKSERKGFYEKV